MKRTLTPELISEIAQKFSTRKAFQKGDASAYQGARRLGILDSVCSHMQMVQREITRERAEEIAARFDTRTSLANADQSIYRAIIKNNWESTAFAHMKSTDVFYNYDTLCEIASKFIKRSDFQDAYPSEYGYAGKIGVLDKICAHMPTLRRTVTKDLAIKVARNHKTRKAFQLADPSLYASCRLRGWIDEICSHMEYAPTGFNDNKPGYLYQIRFTLKCGSSVWKVGITNQSPELRLARMKPPKWSTPKIEISRRYQIGAEARKAETELLQRGNSLGVRYSGKKFLKNGNSELFTFPLLS